jgi:hypothetical protein
LRKTTRFTILCGVAAAVAFTATQAAAPSKRVAASEAPASKPAAVVAAAAPLAGLMPAFKFKDLNGMVTSVPLVDSSSKRKLSKATLAKIDPSLSPKLAQAATIAEERANARSKSKCWRYVKQALLASGAVDSYPKTALAKEAGAGAGERLRFRETTGD